MGNSLLSSAGPPYSNIFMGRLSADGEWSEVTQLGGDQEEQLGQVALDAAGNLTLVGSFSGSTLAVGSTTLSNAGPVGTSDIFVARRNAAGQWTLAVRAGGTSNDKALNVAPGANGTATVAGYFSSSTATLGPFTLSNADASAATTDVFVAQLDAAGAWVSALTAGGVDNQRVSALATDGRGGELLSAIRKGLASRLALLRSAQSALFTVWLGSLVA
ncbi:hypothetical protein [Hymenobacter cellulosilyticus]|uniref:Uncharacterized protein n=1 Tax=Hymenobacter cellulosilyticus TaxID=2932248 RepID=A0A8T9Q5X5_9BACT|nr:hypothetical protein [Hymenobacter cellulosilyticus]UOQ72964.1 hypothetical protein MUN79_02980 [Hymenobacter cellulosilyticus]